MTNDPLGQQNITAEGTIQLKQAVALHEPASECPDYVLRSHTASILFRLTEQSLHARFYETSDESASYSLSVNVRLHEFVGQPMQAAYLKILSK
ncbi:hypothetical protein PQR25_30435 [Paraburkholderia nemoris]|uniref:hypothetical protein n=1 Tax=Paraburkholderia nemoris TaxID=2793076 RepID=UPI0038BDA95A